MRSRRRRLLLLCGGVGGARMARGFSLVDEPLDLTIAVNVGDDFEHLGLSICPDIDTVLYTLAGIANREQGWGIEGESWRTLERLRTLGGETWFQLGDLDLATHLYRSGALAEGDTLSTVTRRLRQRLGITADVLPVTDDRLRTVLDTDRGLLEFQRYFVRERCAPRVHRIDYRGAAEANLSPALGELLDDTSGPLDAVVLTPSNPFLSLGPMLALPGLPGRLRARAHRVLAVSPIISGKAVKGPAAKLMAELGIPVGAAGWAQHLERSHPGLIDDWVIDTGDTADAETLRAAGFRVHQTRILMPTDEQRTALAHTLLELMT